MNLKNYTKDRMYFLIFQISAIGFICFMLTILRLSAYAVFFIALLLILANTFGFLFEYFKKKEFYNTVILNLEALDRKHLISELIDKPSFSEGILLYDTLKAAGKSMNDMVAEYKISSDEYREYIETWVHEIKTPISASKLIIDNHKSPITQSLNDELVKIEGFVEQALFYSKSNNVEKDYIIKEFILADLIKGCVKKHARALIESKVTVKLENLELPVYADIKWMDFIIGQILTNSIKYRGEAPAVNIWAAEGSNCTVLSIEDNGIGINERDINRVFDKGFTGENGRRFAKSTGIGLYLCSKLCKKMGLGIEISSEICKGTKINIIFPKGKTILTEQ